MSATYECQEFRRERDIRTMMLMKLKKYALELLREALYAANAASKATKTGNPKRVWKAMYEAVIASAPINIRDMANFLRNQHGSRSIPHFEA